MTSLRTSSSPGTLPIAALLLTCLVGCQGELTFESRGLRAGGAMPDAGLTDAGRIVLTFGDAGPGPDAARPEEPPACTPGCSGRECGPDGCGGSCGTCGAGEVCSASFQCEAPPPSCTPSCSGRECGADGCGGSCGSCASGESCSAAQQCEASPPTGGHSVTMWGASWCGACSGARAFFMANGVTYTYRNVENPADQAAMIQRAMELGYPLDGSVGLPVLVIDSTMTEGWSEGRVRDQLEL